MSSTKKKKDLFVKLHLKNNDGRYKFIDARLDGA